MSAKRTTSKSPTRTEVEELQDKRRARNGWFLIVAGMFASPVVAYIAFQLKKSGILDSVNCKNLTMELRVGGFEMALPILFIASGILMLFGVGDWIMAYVNRKK